MQEIKGFLLFYLFTFCTGYSRTGSGYADGAMKPIIKTLSLRENENIK